MSTDCVDDDTKEWDYLCPQFCDFNATETTDQLKEIDHFFQVDHELEEQKSNYGEDVISAPNTPIIDCKSQLNPIINGFKDLNENNDDFKYETPPQNKENFEDDDNDVFYSTKKYLSVEKKYKLRSTPMRTLQYNGSTPLRETRISSKKKKTKRSKGELKKLGEESLFTMEGLLQTLPTLSAVGSPALIDSKSEEDLVEKPFAQQIIEEKIEVYLEVVNKGNTDQQNEDVIETEQEEVEVFDSDDLQIESEDNVAVNRRESYIIEKVPRTVTVVSPIKSSKTTLSLKKRFTNSFRRKGTPIRKSVLSSGRKVSSKSIVSRLYSSVKKPQNEYKSMAELLKEFETQPRGFDRSRSLDRDCNGQRSRSSSVSSLTRPRSPKLHSIQRHRPTPRQTEDIIASQIKKYSFKAHPIRKKLFDANFASGIPRVKSSKAPTKAIPMNFLTEKRHELRTKHSTNDEKPEVDSKSHFKANPMPAFKNPNILQTKSEKKVTSFRPFSFDDRIQQLVTKKRTQSEDNTKTEIPRNTFRF